jgi:hypothetical protein
MGQQPSSPHKANQHTEDACTPHDCHVLQNNLNISHLMHLADTRPMRQSARTPGCSMHVGETHQCMTPSFYRS